MKLIEFPEQNCVFAKDQPEYLPLPAHKTAAGRVISCWELDEAERRQVAEMGVIWLDVLTFGLPLQPLRPYVERPFQEEPAAGSAGSA